jgi:hypothetical protein
MVPFEGLTIKKGCGISVFCLEDLVKDWLLTYKSALNLLLASRDTTVVIPVVPAL